ncbi:unnamed protein product [marine sediment metagenome]|uniref:Uncharacterized protein n=1 Tax=marine sediment metagenome TaxID=412755 RepID=X1BEI5_9ZZZZ
MVYFQALSAAAAIGTTVYDEGLRSTAENPKRLLSVLIQGWDKPSKDDMLQIWHEQEKIAEIPYSLIDNVVASNVVNMWSVNRINEIEVGFEIPVGAVVKVAIKAVEGGKSIIGAYRYEIIT